MSGDTATLRAMLEPVVESLGFDLVEVELSGQGGRAILRLYIDSHGGVTVDDCAKVSHQASAVLDVEDPVSGQYTLEVSSPGLDRPLVKRRDFERFLGETVKVRMSRPAHGRRNFTGQLTRMEGGSIILEAGAESFSLPLEDIDKARLVPRYK